MKLSKMRCCRLFMLVLGMGMILMGNVKAEAAQDDTICDGVYIDNINVSGMTQTEAKEAVDRYVEGLMEKEIGVVLDEEVSITSVGELGYSCDENTYIEEAMDLGKIGNLIKRYKELKDVANGGVYYKLDFRLSDDAVADFIASSCSIYDVPAKNATVQRSNGQFVYSKEVVGRKLDVEATTKTINEAILKDWNQMDIVVDATIVDDVPKYGMDVVQKCNTLLGTATTNYATSSTERKNNIANAARLISNSVVYPGDTFSCYEKMNPFTSDNGYYSAHAYVNGMVEDSIGGGVCQVSTTLYNAILRAELDVVERAAHSMTVSYVQVAFDAAIAGTYKDLKFRNNLDVPVLVEAYANGSNITFNIYGYETRDTVNRRVEYKSEIISKTEPPKDVITEDPTQPTTYRKVTQSAYTGYVAVLYKYVYKNGQLVDTIQVNKSTYKASPAYITVGTKVVEEETPDKEENDGQVADDDKNNTAKPENNKPESNKPQADKPESGKPENGKPGSEDESDKNNSAAEDAQGDSDDENEDDEEE